MTTSNPSSDHATGESHNSSSGASAARTGSLFGTIMCRGIVPAWLFTGALVKLLDGTPALLPKQVRGVYTWIAKIVGMGAEADLTRFFDIALRGTISMEFTLAAAMILLPRFSRAIAALVLTLFVAILVSVVISGDASCGCFGSKGPPPIVVLIIDGSLLACVLFFKPKHATRQAKTTGALAGAWVAASAFAVAITFGLPAKMMVQAQPIENAPPSSTATASTTIPAPSKTTATITANTSATTPTIPTPSKTTATTTANTSATTPTSKQLPAQTAATATSSASSSAWPKPPAQLQPYYMPQVEQWVGKPLRSQPLAALIQQPLPTNLEQGRWIVMFFRKDCDHCHEVLEKHFMVKLPAPTLLISIPDTNPASELPNPCTECIETSFIKGPEYVVGTPILMSIENGIVKRVCIDTDNRESLEATLQFR
ncbi:MAG: MauE/DoxX family redox-associated membrane protein [Phycisphaerales bacterium]